MPFSYPHQSNGFSTSIWGPPLWHVLHIISLNYPQRPTAADKKAYTEFLRALGGVLPCGDCRKNYPQNLRQLGFDNPTRRRSILRNRDSFARFMVRLHRYVNRKTDRPFTTSYRDLRNCYEHFRARCGSGEGCVEPVQFIKSQAVVHLKPYHKRTPSFRLEGGCNRKL